MKFSVQALLPLGALVSIATAHVHLVYPPPRGPFVANQEPSFCDGYPNSSSNRTLFPLNGGFISITSGHPLWTLGVLLSPLDNPQNFANFSQAVQFFQVQGQGAFCFPVDFAAAGIPGVKDGANVTIQLEFDGGDGLLFQCADITLSSAATIDSSVSCTNATGDIVNTLSSTPLFPSGVASTGTTPLPTSASSTGAAPSTTSSSAALSRGSVSFAGLLCLTAAFVSFM